MNESYLINLNDRQIFPIVNNLEKYLHKQIPIGLDYYNYKNLAEYETESGEHFNRFLSFITEGFEKSKIYIESLTSERDNYLLTSIPGNEQRDFNLYRYNVIVIKQVNRVIDFIYRGLEYNIPSSFNDNTRHELNFKQYFKEWYKEFSNDEPIQIPLPTAGNAETPTNGTQELIQIDNLLRFENVGQKYLLLKELGIIDFLDSRYPITTNAKKSLLYAYITDTKNSKSFENILTNIGNINSDKYPYVERNVNKIIRIFDELSIIEQNKIAAIKRDNKK